MRFEAPRIRSDPRGPLLEETGSYFGKVISTHVGALAWPPLSGIGGRFLALSARAGRLLRSWGAGPAPVSLPLVPR
jgi:hypothetical protein